MQLSKRQIGTLQSFLSLEIVTQTSIPNPDRVTLPDAMLLPVEIKLLIIRWIHLHRRFFDDPHFPSISSRYPFLIFPRYPLYGIDGEL